MNEPKKRVRVPALKEKKLRGEKITVLTAYDCTMAGLMDRAPRTVIFTVSALEYMMPSLNAILPAGCLAITCNARA